MAKKSAKPKSAKPKDRRAGAKAPKTAGGSKAGARADAADANVPGRDKASGRFVRDLQVRGEASKPDAEGKLPADATHAITGEDEDGTVEVKRARFKTY